MTHVAAHTNRPYAAHRGSLLLSRRATRTRHIVAMLGHGLLLLITSSSALAVLFIFGFIAWDALPFFLPIGREPSLLAWVGNLLTQDSLAGFAAHYAHGVGFAIVRLQEFFGGTTWDPSRVPGDYGVLPMFVGSGLVTGAAALFAVPLGISAAVCLSDILPFHVRQVVKPVIEVLAAIPSVAFGFFAFIVLAPLLQDRGGLLLAIGWWCTVGPILALSIFVLSDVLAPPGKQHSAIRGGLAAVMVAGALTLLIVVGNRLGGIEISSGTNALNVSVILGIMALPTVISVSEDALQAVGRELREGAYALGATRAEMLVRVTIPAAASGICAAVILGLMRAIGETMVVWMAAGNAAQIPTPWYDLLEPVRTLTATIAGEMGEADQMTGSARYHVLWAIALALLTISFTLNLASEWVMRRQARLHR